MEIRADAFSRHLSGTLKFAYLLSGDEPLLVLEASDQLRAAAREKGFIERHVFDVNAHTDWADVRYEAQAMGLFASQKLIELRLSAGKIDAEGSELIAQWCAQPPEGILLLVICPEWKKDLERASWVRAINDVGAQLIFWPLKREELPTWLVKRAAAAGLTLEQDAANALADRVEGNLLAAKQELDGLRLLALEKAAQGQANAKFIGNDDIEAFVADGARFSTASVVDAALLGDAERAVRVLRALALEGEETFMVLSTVVRQIELMHELAQAKAAGGQAAVARLYPTRGVWPARQRIYDRALARAPAELWRALVGESASVDQIVKGRKAGEPWLALERLVLRVALKPELGARFA
jgi:DNA polymerase III subunit delta